jgi:hypothetical protein
MQTSRHGEWYRPVAATNAAHPSLTAATPVQLDRAGSDSRTRPSARARRSVAGPVESIGGSLTSGPRADDDATALRAGIPVG